MLSCVIYIQSSRHAYNFACVFLTWEIYTKISELIYQHSWMLILLFPYEIFKYNRFRLISPPLIIMVLIFFWWYLLFFLFCIVSWPWLDLSNQRISSVVYPVDGASISYSSFFTPLCLHMFIYIQWVGKTRDYFRSALCLRRTSAYLNYVQRISSDKFCENIDLCPASNGEVCKLIIP